MVGAAIVVLLVVDTAVTWHVIGRMREQGKRLDQMQDAIETLGKVFKDIVEIIDVSSSGDDDGR